MSFPLVIVCGQAGSGKDTVGDHLARTANGITLGLADPMKRFAAELFGYSQEQLFGPSEERNKIDPRFTADYIKTVVRPRLAIGRKLIADLLPHLDQNECYLSLDEWLQNCRTRAAVDNGLSARFVLQTIGTEWGRGLDVEVWSRYAVTTARKLLGAGHDYTRGGGLVRNSTKTRPPNVVIITDGRFANEIVNTTSAGGCAVHVVRNNASLAAATATAGIAGHASEASLSDVPDHFYNYRIGNNGTLQELIEKATLVGQRVMYPAAPILLPDHKGHVVSAGPIC